MHTDARKALETRLAGIGVREQDLTEQFVRSGGHGGQNVNKVSTCVILTHLPSGISVRCEEERSQARNRFLARERLAARMEALAHARAARERQAAEKSRRQKRRRSKGAKERMLKQKHHRSEIKKHRQAPPRDDQ